MFHGFMGLYLIEFNYALIIVLLLFAPTSHLMLYPAPHSEYSVSANCTNSPYICIITNARAALVGYTNVAPNKSYPILPYLTTVLDR